MSTKSEQKLKVNQAVTLLREEPVFNYLEGQHLADLVEYISNTYGEHYAANPSMQTIDIWEAKESLETTSVDTAIKYLMRYGKKAGRNKKDLLKAAHYILLAMYATAVDEDETKSNIQRRIIPEQKQ